MHIIVDVNKISKTVQRNLTFILNVLSESSIHFTQLSIVFAKKNVGCVTVCNYAGTCKSICSYNLVYNFLMQLFPLKSLVFAVHFLNAFWHGQETFPKSSSQNVIVLLLIVFHLPHSKYKGLKMFLLVPLSKSKFFTCVTLVSFVQHSCRTRVVSVALVSHLCSSCLTRVTSVTLLLLVSGTRVVNQTRSYLLL